MLEKNKLLRVLNRNISEFNSALDSVLDAKEHENLGLNDLLVFFSEIKEIKEIMDEAKTKLNKHYDRLRIGIVPEKMEEKNITKITVKNIGTVYLADDMSVSIKAGNKEKAFEYFRANDMSDLIQETIHAGTLKATIKSSIQKGELIPHDLFNINPFSKAVVRKL